MVVSSSVFAAYFAAVAATAGGGGDAALRGNDSGWAARWRALLAVARSVRLGVSTVRMYHR